jgi:hypothetical protein
VSEAPVRTEIRDRRKTLIIDFRYKDKDGRNRALPRFRPGTRERCERLLSEERPHLALLRTILREAHELESSPRCLGCHPCPRSRGSYPRRLPGRSWTGSFGKAPDGSGPRSRWPITPVREAARHGRCASATSISAPTWSTFGGCLDRQRVSAKSNSEAGAACSRAQASLFA